MNPPVNNDAVRLFGPGNAFGLRQYKVMLILQRNPNNVGAILQVKMRVATHILLDPFYSAYCGFGSSERAVLERVAAAVEHLCPIEEDDLDEFEIYV
jgi:hypothetical protein